MEFSAVVRRAALCSACVGSLVSPRHATAASYSTPDYSVNANVSPYTTSGPITIVFSVSNLSDVSAPATTVEFSAAPVSNLANSSVLGQASVSALGPWSSTTKTVSFPLPSWLPVGTLGMRLTANVNPTHGNGEVKTANNSVTSSFSAVVTATSQPPPSPPSTPPSTSASTSFVGFGASTPGGTGRPIYTVTSLAASGSGTLKDAVSQSNRYIKFAVAGTINLSDGILVTGSFLTIDGLSALAPGITLKGGGLYMHGNKGAHDVIVRGIRVRDAIDDGFRVAYGGYNIVIDHVSSQGAGDGNVDITESSHDVTVSWSIFVDPVSGKNSLLAYRASRLTMHHNLFMEAGDRNPDLAYDYSGAQASDTTLDLWNNLVWDWFGGVGTKVLYGARANVVNNYFYAPGGDNQDALVVCSAKGVPSAHQGDCNYGDAKRYARAFVKGNVTPAALGRDLNAVGTEANPFLSVPTTPQSACAAAAEVRAKAGAFPLDSVDKSYLSVISLQSSLCP